MKPDWVGIYPAVLTPFKNDQIDFEMFKHNVTGQLSAGVDGIILAGSLGEASTLTNDEKAGLLSFSKTFISDRPVIINIAEQSTREAVLRAQQAEKDGADGLMLLPPMRYAADDREALEFFITVAENTSLPLLIYNNPVDYKTFVTLDMFEKLTALPNVQAVKESTRDVTNILRMRNRFGDRFKILCGVDPLAFESLCLGADGWVAGLVNAFPFETVALFKLVSQNRIGEALSIYRWFLPLLELDIHPKLVQYIKLAAAVTGLGSEEVRAPRLKLQGSERESILQTINEALRTRPSVGSLHEAICRT